MGSSATKFCGSGADHRADQEGQVLAGVAPVQSVYLESEQSRQMSRGGLISRCPPSMAADVGFDDRTMTIDDEIK